MSNADRDALVTEISALQQQQRAAKAFKYSNSSNATLWSKYHTATATKSASSLAKSASNYSLIRRPNTIVYNSQIRTIQSVLKENIHRMTGVTQFTVRELGQSGFGLRFENLAESGNALESPFYVLVRRNSKGQMQVMLHTMPSCVPVEKIASRYLGVNLQAFVARIRRELNAQSARKIALSGLRKDVASIDYSEDAKIVNIVCKDGTSMNLVCQDDAVVQSSHVALMGPLTDIRSRVLAVSATK